MYADLLTRALGKEAPCTGRTTCCWPTSSRPGPGFGAEDTATTPADEVLARELSYDGALLRLCESLDVPAATPCTVRQPGAASGPGSSVSWSTAA